MGYFWYKLNRQSIYHWCILFIFIVFFPFFAHAGLIRDAEIEDYLKDLSDPVFKAAGLSSSQIRMFIVNDDRINAFVAGGSNMFLHTGLITETQTPEMLLGVIAHETGHIAGGHIVRMGEYYDRAQIAAILGYLVGAAAVAAGGSDVGAAIMAGGTHASTRNMLSYSRANEQSADQAALSYLDTLGVSSEGMMLMFERLRREEKQHISPDVDVYYRTHPLNQERITHIRNHLQSSPYKSVKLSDTLHQRHERAKAKLIGFLAEGREVLQLFPLTDTSIPARIARSIAYAAMSQAPQALNELNHLEKDLPDDAYIHELKGHILHDAGRLQEAAASYQRAAALKPSSALIASDYARTLVSLGDIASLQEAKKQLVASSQIDPTYHQTWRLLAQLYGRENNIGMAELSLAELAALNNDKEELLRRLDKADQYLDPYSASAIRAEDLRLLAKTMKDEKKEMRE